jgi:hypothetical protein
VLLARNCLRASEMPSFLECPLDASEAET